MKQELDPTSQVQLRYRDINPDTGTVASDGLIGMIAPKWANALLITLQEAQADEPNREYYLKQPPAAVKSAPRPVAPPRKDREPGPGANAPKNNGYTPYGEIEFGPQPKRPKI